MSRMGQPWQLRALTYYDQIGEIRFASQFYAKLLSKVRFYPARQLENGDTEEIKDGLPLEILHRIQDPGGGRSRLLYDYGRMMFVTGEGVLFGDRLETEQERWRFLWKDEVKPSDYGEGWQRVRYDMTPYEPPQVGEAYRFWTPHPRHSDLPDSPLRSIMDIAEELLVLTASVMGTATTRMTNGILLMPTEASPNPVRGARGRRLPRRRGPREQHLPLGLHGARLRRRSRTPHLPPPRFPSWQRSRTSTWTGCAGCPPTIRRRTTWSASSARRPSTGWRWGWTSRPSSCSG